MNPADTHFEAPQFDPAMAALVPVLLVGAVLAVAAIFAVIWTATRAKAWAKRHPLLCLFMLGVVAYGVTVNVLSHPYGSPSPASGWSAKATKDIPAGYRTQYVKAGRHSCTNVRAQVLAGIGKVESNHGRARLPGVTSGQNFAGAAGPMQFGNGTGKAGNAWARYGKGGDVYDPKHAIPAAARYLCAAGAAKDLRGAIYSYNHSRSYVDLVLKWAKTYTGPAKAKPRNLSALSGLLDLGGLGGARIVPPVAPVRGRACPVPNSVFVSSWGAPRVGHSHQGNDLMAPAGSPVRAFAAGTVSRVSNRDVGLGGLSVWVAHPDGSASYYAHQSSNDAHVGQRVVAGQLIGRVGNSGNAHSTAPHTHFEWHPRGRGTPAVDPYPLLRKVCRGAR